MQPQDPPHEPTELEATEPLSLASARVRRRRNGPRASSAPRRRDEAASEVIEFGAAAERAATRNTLVGRLKKQVQSGSYRADPTEIAKAMERRSDA